MSNKAPEKSQKKRKRSWWRELIWTVVIVLAVRAFLFEPFSIPSGSMMPNLLIGDYLFVNKWKYGWNKHSFMASLPLLPGRVGGSPPRRGDVLVFRLPSDKSVHYVKRLIGLPGDRVQVINGVVWLNGQALEQQDSGMYESKSAVGYYKSIRTFTETIPGEKSYTIMREDYGKDTPANNTREFVVPEGHYFCLGDNRDNSADSRFRLGCVPADLVVGTPFIIFFSINESILDLINVAQWSENVRLGRFFSYLGDT